MLMTNFFLSSFFWRCQSQIAFSNETNETNFFFSKVWHRKRSKKRKSHYLISDDFCPNYFCNRSKLKEDTTRLVAKDWILKRQGRKLPGAYLGAKTSQSVTLIIHQNTCLTIVVANYKTSNLHSKTDSKKLDSIKTGIKK